jgi:hypothetical protein
VTKAARLRDRGTGIIDVARVIQSYLSSNYFKAPAATPQSVVPYVDFTVKAGETYVDVTGTRITNTDVVTATARAYNSALPTLTAYVTNGAVYPYLNDWQTLRPDSWYSIDAGEDNFLVAYPAETGAYDAVEVKKYDGYNGTGTVLSTVTTTVSGPVFVNAGTGITGASFTVRLKAGASYVGRTMQYNVDACSPYETVPLHFLNPLGGFDSVYFRYKSRRKVGVERKSAGQVAYKKNGSAIEFASGQVVRETAYDFYTQSAEVLNVSTDILSDDEWEWLRDLVTSPLVYTEVTVGVTKYYVPVSVKANEYEVRKSINDKPGSLSLDIEFSQKNNSQLR